jgi:transcriptional regulator with XRE-family HTH domain
MKFTEPVNIDNNLVVDPALYIRQLRIEQDKTLKDIAGRTGLNDGYISFLENGKRPISEENFMKIMVQGLDLEEDSARYVWNEYMKQQNPNKQLAAKNIASKKYKVISRGFNLVEDDVCLTLRWVIDGRIYLWHAFDTGRTYLNVNDPLAGTNVEGSWSEIFSTLGKEETLLLFSAILDELEKEVPDGSYQTAARDKAKNDIEDLHDSVETIQVIN